MYIKKRRGPCLSIWMACLFLCHRLVSRNIFVSLIYYNINIFLRIQIVTSSSCVSWEWNHSSSSASGKDHWTTKKEDKTWDSFIDARKESIKHRITDESQSFSLSVSVVLFVSHSLDGCLRNTCFMQRVFSWNRKEGREKQRERERMRETTGGEDGKKKTKEGVSNGCDLFPHSLKSLYSL